MTVSTNTFLSRLEQHFLGLIPPDGDNQSEVRTWINTNVRQTNALSTNYPCYIIRMQRAKHVKYIVLNGINVNR